MRKFSNIFAIFLISVAMISLLSTVCVAQQDTSNIQVTLKSKNWGPDPAMGGSRATITITMNKIGHLAYVEEYYGTDANSQQKLYSGNRYEANMSDYTISFDLNRPNARRQQYWSTINAKVMLDGVIVYEIPINTSGTYKSFTGRAIWLNNSVIDIGKGRPSIQKKEPFDPTGGIAEVQTNNTENIDNNSTKVIVPAKSPTLDIPVAIAILFAVYIFVNKKNRTK
jgi:hypothetical protein